MNFLFLFLKEIRLHHWIKNFLVFAPLFFAGHVMSVSELKLTFLLFLAFCFLASGIYIFNDILDKDRDAQHPHKKNRPIASGKMSVRTALLIMFIFLVCVAYISIYFNLKTNILLGLYFLLNLSYSLILKHIALLDIFLVAGLYILRIKAGGELIDVHVSEWLILVTLFLALFLVIGKRRAELISVSSEKTRLVLREYTREFLDYCLTVVVAGTLLTYSLYAISANIPYLVYSTFFVFFGMFRYMYVIYILDGGRLRKKFSIRIRGFLQQ